MEYMSSGGEGAAAAGCVFCEKLARDSDEESHILWRGNRTFVILNAFPYNTGHLLLMPKMHVAGLEEMDAAGRAELFEVCWQSTRFITSAMGAEGFNVGMNLGSAAGAGIPGHLHLHVVPRWSGDTNFMPVTGDTKVLPEMLTDTYGKLRPLFDTLG